MILCIVINTATCERLFSELALIHTDRRNRLQPAKTTQISIVRSAVRKISNLEDKAIAQKDESVGGRIIEAEEREHLTAAIDRHMDDGAQDEQMQENQEANEEANEDADPNEDDTPVDEIFFTWSTVLGMASCNNDDGDTSEVLEEDVVRGAWPADNVENWPQEAIGHRLTGIRGKKVPLATLFKGVIIPQCY